MIHQFEVPAWLHDRLPEMEAGDNRLKPLLQVFCAINRFTDFTATALSAHHYLLAGRCFSLADELYRQGDRLIRNLIRYSYVGAFQGILAAGREDRFLIRSLIPFTLYRLYEEDSEAFI